jgi:DNA-directed RNA polymerase specialized sigma24 family protein
VAPDTGRAGQAGGQDGERLDRLLAARGDHLLHTAIALTGSRLDAEDLLQAVVERLLRRRGRVDDLEAYLRRILYNLAADGWRRREAWHRMHRLLPSRPNDGTGPDPVTTVDLRDASRRRPPHHALCRKHGVSRWLRADRGGASPARAGPVT